MFSAVSIFLVAFFTYFYQEDTQSPWKVLKAYYRFKQPCSYSSRNRNWEMHSGVFHQCTECQGKWHKIKITVSFFVSLVYPILWLALGFLQQTYYPCAHVGPDPRGILDYCDNWKNLPENYNKNYGLAINKSIFVGNVLVVVVIVLASALFITYRVIKSKIQDKDDKLEIEDNYHHQRPSQTPTNNFGHDNQEVVTPGSHAQTSSPFTRSAHGPSPGTGPTYEGFRERSGDMGRGRASPRETQPLIKVDA